MNLTPVSPLWFSLSQGVEEEVKTTRNAKQEPVTAAPPTADNGDESTTATAAAAGATEGKKVTKMIGVAKVKHDPSTVKGELMEGNIDAMEVYCLLISI